MNSVDITAPTLFKDYFTIFVEKKSHLILKLF